MPELSKLQIRAKVLSVISKIKLLQYHNEEALQELIDELSEIQDKKAMFDVFLKEYMKLDEEDYNFCAYLLKSEVPVDYITEKAIECLKSASLSDEYKYKIVQLLRITGSCYNYEEIPDYFKNPQEVMDLETKRLLDSAVFNPESMLDFLDFVSAVSEKDRKLLLKSLSTDYKGDTLANIVYPVLYSDFNDEFILQTIDVLCESKSSLAIAPFEFLIETSKNESIVNTCKKGLKILKLTGASKDKADLYFKNIVKNSIPHQSLVTIPDGSGKQALLITRKHDNGKISIAAVVISDFSGIVDCFGFYNITQEEVIRIIRKFYNSEGQYIVPFEYIKSQIQAAQKTNIINKFSFPYEFICWKPMFYDLPDLEYSIEDYVHKYCKVKILSDDDVISLMTKEYTFRWFLTSDDNKIIKFSTEQIYNKENINIEEINNLLRENTDTVFDEKTTVVWKNKIYNLIFILRHNNKLEDADNFYTILNNERLFKLFRQIIVQRSIFNYFSILKENVKDTFFTKNIFKKKNANENKYDIKKLNKIIGILKRGWFVQ